MFIIPLPGKRSELEDLRWTHDVFNLLANDCSRQYYLILRKQTLTFIGQGTVPGKAAYQIKSRSISVGHKDELPKNHGNVGFLGTYSNIEDAVLKLFPREGHCVSNMKYAQYTGQKLSAHPYHYAAIKPLLALLGDTPAQELSHFLHTLGASPDLISCKWHWGSGLELYCDGTNVKDDLELWFSYFCAKTLQ